MHDLDDVELDRRILQLLADGGNAQPGSPGTELRVRPSTRTTGRLVASAAAILLIGVAAAIVMSRGPGPATSTVSPTSTLESTTSTSAKPSTTDPSSLPPVPAEVTRVPVPPAERTVIGLVDGLTWTIDASGADNGVCLMSEIAGAGSAAGPCQGDRAAGTQPQTLSGFYSKIDRTGVVAVVQYWLLPNPVTVSLQSAQGEPLCIAGPTSTPAYEGTTLWTCALGPDGPPADAAAVFNVEGDGYVQVPPTRPYPCNRGATYVIEAGDTPSAVAERFDLSPEVLAVYNLETDGYAAFAPGTKIQVPQVC